MVLHKGRSNGLIASAFRSKLVLLPCTILLVLFAFYSSQLRTTYDDYRGPVPRAVLPNELSEISNGRQWRFRYRPKEWQAASIETVQSKYAFATFLAGKADDADDGSRGVNDHYFVATRLLAYQLLHATHTRSRDRTIPFIVLVTERVNEDRRARLRKDGAIVLQVDFIRSEWVRTDTSTWQDVMTKLRLWELTQFERICFVDGDTVLAEPLDGIFQDDAVISQIPGEMEDEVFDDEAAIPPRYTFASVPEMNRSHHFPPSAALGDYMNPDYLNAGFFIFEPSLKMLNYYLSLMNTKNKFNPAMPEQNLLNYAHRRNGNMPWLQVNNTWNVHYPKMNDVEGGVKSVHDKWWAPEFEEMRPWLQRWRFQMEGYFEARDAIKASLTRVLDGRT